MLICVTMLPSMSRIAVPAGRRSSNPGISGFVMTTSPVVGDVIATAWAMSNLGIQIVYGRTLVLLAVIWIPTLKMPYVFPALLALRPSIIITRRPLERDDSRNLPVLSVCVE